jgi:hypothetical protein
MKARWVFSDWGEVGGGGIYAKISQALKLCSLVVLESVTTALRKCKEKKKKKNCNLLKLYKSSCLFAEGLRTASKYSAG